MQLTEIKSQLSLFQILTHYGLKPDRNNRLNCPFHPDKTPSLQLYPKTHTAYCFSSNCPTHGKSMDVIDFVMHKEGCTKHEAILKAKSFLNGTPVETPSTSEPDKIATLTQIFDYFKNGVSGSKPAKEYLAKRKLHPEKTEVGYNSGQFHYVKRAETDLLESCKKYGLLLEMGSKSRTGNRAYRPFGKWCVVFALRNEQHEITGLYFRSTLEKKEQRHFYLKDRSGLYPHYPGPKTKRLILTESIIDAASLLEQAEIKNKYSVLALYGTNGLTAEHQRAIASLKDLEEIIFLLNGDEAGRKASQKYGSMLSTEYPKIKITNVAVPEGEDVNSLLQGHEAEVLTELLDRRKPLDFSFSVEESIENKKESTPEPVKSPGLLNSDNPQNLIYTGQVAEYQIKGFKTDQLDSLKIALQIIASSQMDHRCKLDLYEYGQVRKTALTASERLDIRNDLLEKDLSRLTGLLEEYQTKTKNQNGNHRQKIAVPKVKAQACLAFLKEKNLIKKLNELIGKAGIRGEENNRLLLFIIASSYKMPDTLHGLIQGSSGSGKTRLMRTISELMPTEDVKRYTRVTDNSFYNQDEYFFVHKLVCFEDLDGLKEDAQLAVRELQSNEILITSTSIKDATGSIRGGERVVRGPIASLSCTTKGELYEDNISRCFLIGVDESSTQTENIIDYQNRLAAGLIDKGEEEKTKAFLQNCIRLLKPMEVINPYAHRIQLPKDAHKIRRLNELYQSFVRQITLLHQYQRKQDGQGRLISEKEDLQTACDILFESILLKVDELDGSLRQFFEQLKDYIKAEKREFTQREVRQALHISKSQMQRYMYSLQALGYVHQSSGFINKGLRYRIDYWDNHHKRRAEIRDYLQNQLATL